MGLPDDEQRSARPARRCCERVARALEDVNLDPAPGARKLRPSSRAACASASASRARSSASRDHPLRRAGHRPRPRQRAAIAAHRRPRSEPGHIDRGDPRLEQALQMSDRVALLDSGKLRFVGPPSSSSARATTRSFAPPARPPSRHRRPRGGGRAERQRGDAVSTEATVQAMSSGQQVLLRERERDPQDAAPHRGTRPARARCRRCPDFPAATGTPAWGSSPSSASSPCGSR